MTETETKEMQITCGVGRVRFSFFDNLRVHIPVMKEFTWDEFCDELGPHEFVDTPKDDLPAFSPAEYREGVPRANANVVAMHAFVLDIDGKSYEDVFESVKRAEGFAMFVYSTYSHGIKPGVHVRVVMPLNRPVTREEWPLVWNAMSAFFKNIGDPMCQDVSRLYIRCFAPKGCEDHHFCEKYEGDPIDVDSVYSWVKNFKTLRDK